MLAVKPEHATEEMLTFANTLGIVVFAHCVDCIKPHLSLATRVTDLFCSKSKEKERVLNHVVSPTLFTTPYSKPLKAVPAALVFPLLSVSAIDALYIVQFDKTTVLAVIDQL
jgi:hypothetical protein